MTKTRGKTAFMDLSGRRFGHLIVVRRAPSVKKATRWLCRCSCGWIGTKGAIQLLHKPTTSCHGKNARWTSHADETIKQLVRKDKASGCWLWTGAKNKYGYGKTGGGMHGTAHRLSYAVFRGDPGQQMVRHRCGTPSCVNPKHLLLGSHRDNMKDRSQKKRGSISIKRCLRLMDLYWNTQMSFKEAGKKVGMSEQEAIMVARVDWRHLPA